MAVNDCNDTEAQWNFGEIRLARLELAHQQLAPGIRLRCRA